LSLTPGTRLGVYEITAPLGEGGMGQVWRATDTSLGRQVAIKILPAAFAADHDRLARFEGEAKTLASLNHPHIAAIYAVEKSGPSTPSASSGQAGSGQAGMYALVMELVEGEDLSQRIASGAIPIDEALPIATQIAEALEAAHEQGIIHRDLKPANIKVRSDGTVKVLDFGLAKAMDPPVGSSPNVSQSPTITTPAVTQAEMILGTAAYMSPEQARGKTVDKRTDVWAFGAVLYEMLAGVRPFSGEDATEMIAAVVKSTPDWSALPADVPRPLVTLIQRCLEKDRKARVGDIAVARFLLADMATLGSSMPGHVSPVAAPRSASTRALPWAIAGALGVGLLVTLGLLAPWRADAPVDRPLVRLDVDLGADVSLPAPDQPGSSVAISPDGTRLAYVSGTPTRLFIRRLDQPNAVELPGTQGATAPFFSPDGQWVGFGAGRGISKIATEGGSIVPLGDIRAFRGASWAADGSVIVASGRELRRAGTSGAPQVLAAADGELGLFGPQSLPGGTAVLFMADNPGDVNQSTIQVLTLANGQRKTVIRGGASGRYFETADGSGYLVYVNNSTLFAVPFDLATLETRGDAVPIVNDIASEDLSGVGQFDVSLTGTLIYRRDTGRGSALNTLHWVDAKGGTAPLPAVPASVLGPRVSPDGTRVALFTVGRQGTDVVIYDPQRDVTTRVTSGNQDSWPNWSADGRHVVFRRTGGLFQARADGARQPHVLVPVNAGFGSGSFTRDGRRLAYTSTATGTQQIWTVPIEDRGGELHAATPEPFLKSQFIDSEPSFSPDGRWLAYQSNESGTEEVYVRPFPPPATGQGSRWLVSNTGGTAPRWSQNGRELVYRSGDQIMAVSYIVSGDAFVADKPRVWIAALGGAPTINLASVWDLAPDGGRVLVVRPAESAGAAKAEHHVVFLQNFFDELRRRVPLGK
jgi:serine/threonine-protein kinase